MRRALVKYDSVNAGVLTETDQGEYVFEYLAEYIEKYGQQFITFQMPVRKQVYRSNRLFPFFDGLIPEGWLLNIATESWKIQSNDRMGLLLACCQNCIGAVSVHPIINEEDE
ncbi:HipA N-terminal domain-containing protein [Myroides odoratimimus]|uniref:HipA N-terminal domain-containing protein n=1 Tax=Myroides TaxID=76831 RepID=UPI000469996E|nr:MULTISPECIES: HipA N-terminal domain-containing protein [Myroides]APA92002.1 phosphatidylinositol kinase [Myroides sp. ZB35]MCA4793986.1 HipA N-terminal domain-containing protein [Myroides odoratimimus]MCA4807138.1 HipA N-terminal domain-containing protein [Myroides odoratimimus]MCA4821246.1 HipA N-terminal domain-containing protein [Myroides odoratimimus]MCS7471923.1 HipA N-terminal domain-containing protein [Myroides odoratimimus]